ncbi:hypothetical protein [Cellulomonas citrea]|uniref:hypothetical protein n=1 Tax=Cellulomonas citrea TaxID=1909423 RepID=UPI00135B20AD|nr:hypothetical protein [Cellulomonas citrea]
MTTGAASFFQDSRGQVRVTFPWAELHVRPDGLEVRIEPRAMAVVAGLLARARCHPRPLPRTGPAWTARWSQMSRALVGPRSVLLVRDDGAGVWFAPVAADGLDEAVEALWANQVPVELVEGTWWYAFWPRLLVRRLRPDGPRSPLRRTPRAGRRR